ncbi:MAG TPA: tRNA (adenosine(37)-N6)-threonylcarbamoyltransferase complex transferase subunit TsaD [Acidiphilium sp.]|nr:MAG: tRNA (adenosine(37)-N6)-threonylcarbamoyltransferase complex transferase subunit TsaD [Acidiphilium sp. 21-60-14]OYV92268.1 MAG: tRNA (adenosine(37)-N6)-threonylcarbamoyltransferase complex transferase subunit TsaD [Acidiphilium sp. 37-60-79]OZB40554.1 MAG: tRNA (adenosine(37)-N6)-threonylcarbamoyltransferase complex transferase subunit TsaD [Acidiphilium sp. 34-60-192]HQT87361.1 tRNA (adenosine(37)-N6)-threonylcarbamoyltransferase complex transferase subunit TsaD [Acidiphilium sp.]HQU2
MEKKAAPGIAAPILAPILAIESSCDETACAILDADGTVRADLVASQIAEHARFGGVVPEIAARAHLAVLPDMVAQALDQAGLTPRDLGAVAATTGPGLIGGLIVGSNFAKAMALAAGKPFYAINHLEAHALTARLPGIAPSQPEFPYLCLLVSGGHTLLLAVDGVGRYRRLGTTIDDAAGEAFDKVAKLLGLAYPGGPALERLAIEGNPTALALPRPMRGRDGCDFSFSGLKTAVAQKLFQISGALATNEALPRQIAADCAASFQAAMVDIFADRLEHALRQTSVAHVIVAGGVAANQAIRAALGDVAAAHGAQSIAPPLRLCTDNAVMVAWAAQERRRAQLGPDPLDAPCRPRWPLTSIDKAH